MKPAKKQKGRLHLKAKATERHRHQVATVSEEEGWNQHEPNSGMARMFVIMLLIHIVVIGGIIVYDLVKGEKAPSTALVTADSAAASALPPASVNAATLDRAMPIQDYATYEWRTGDSLASVAAKLEVSEEVLIKLNMLDKGVQIDQHTILRYPRKPVVRAVALGVAGANGQAAKPASVDIADHPPGAGSAPGISLQPTILERLTPAPEIGPMAQVRDAPPAGKAESGSGGRSRVTDQPPAKSAEVPKAVPITREIAAKLQSSVVSERTGGISRTYVVKPGDSLSKIAAKYGVSVAALQKANNIAKPHLLRLGAKLSIPVN